MSSNTPLSYDMRTLLYVCSVHHLSIDGPNQQTDSVWLSITPELSDATTTIWGDTLDDLVQNALLWLRQHDYQIVVARNGWVG